MNSCPQKEFHMSHALIHGIFPNHTSATSALEALNDAGFRPDKISIIGEDSDGFRQATATLHSTKGDKFVLWAGVAGAVLGGFAGLLGMPELPRADVSTLTMVPIWAAFTGTAIGLSAGFTIGGLLRIDDIPRSEAEVRLGNVHDGEMAVSVTVADLEELRQVESLFIKDGATHVSVDPTSDFMPIPQAVPELMLVQEAAA
jgi:hypothetical protein